MFTRIMWINEALLKELGSLARRNKGIAHAAKESHRTIDISIKQRGYVHSMYYITAHK